MSPPQKRLRTDTLSSSGVLSVDELTNLTKELQLLVYNPNGDIQVLEDAGGLGLDDDSAPIADLLAAAGAATSESRTRVIAPVQQPNLAEDLRVNQFLNSMPQTRQQTALTWAASHGSFGIAERTLQNGFCLPNDPPRPPFQRATDFRVEPRENLPGMAAYAIDAIHDVLQDVALQWPQASSSKAVQARYALISPWAFYKFHLQERFEQLAARQANSIGNDPRFKKECLVNYDLGITASENASKTRGWDVQRLLNKLEQNPAAPGLRQQLLLSFNNMVSIKIQTPGSSKSYKKLVSIPEQLKLDCAFAKEASKTIQQYRWLGQWAQENAYWVPCGRISEAELATLKGQFIAESNEIADLAQKNRALQKENILIPDNTWTRIVKPGPDVGPVSIIFYDLAAANQRGSIEEVDIFGAVIYNAKDFSDIASEISQEAVELQAQAIMASLRAREAIRRGFTSSGSMVKSPMGVHSTNGAVNTPVLPVDPIKSNNPQQKTKEKLAEQTSLRVRVQDNKDLIQCYNYALLEGFMPHWAKAQMTVAESANLLNFFGYPNTASFASFAYGAPIHCDEDDTVTMGWISARSKKIKNDESNFFYANFKLIVQMATDTHWIWDAKETWHGTSLSRLCCSEPKSWKVFAKNNVDLGQWSRANVITHALATSMQKHNF